MLDPWLPLWWTLDLLARYPALLAIPLGAVAAGIRFWWKVR